LNVSFYIFIYILIVTSGIKQKLLEAGTNTIATLPRVFRSLSSFDGKNTVSINDFFYGLSNYGVNLKKEEALVLIKNFDKTGSDAVNFDDFLYSIRGKPNDERQAVIDLVYYKFDKNKTGYTEATELRKVFNCVKHPRFLMGDYTEDQIFYLYLQNFSHNVSGTVTKKVIIIIT
jgi:Ca2+-binding EF-hand superfamily protein